MDSDAEFSGFLAFFCLTFCLDAKSNKKVKAAK